MKYNLMEDQLFRVAADRKLPLNSTELSGIDTCSLEDKLDLNHGKTNERRKEKLLQTLNFGYQWIDA